MDDYYDFQKFEIVVFTITQSLIFWRQQLVLVGNNPMNIETNVELLKTIIKLLQGYSLNMACQNKDPWSNNINIMKQRVCSWIKGVHSSERKNAPKWIKLMTM